MKTYDDLKTESMIEREKEFIKNKDKKRLIDILKSLYYTIGINKETDEVNKKIIKEVIRIETGECIRK